MSVVKEALARIAGRSSEMSEQVALFTGADLRGLADRFAGESDSSTSWVETLEKGQEILTSVRKSAKAVLIVVSTKLGGGNFGDALRELVNPLEAAILPNPRTVVVGEIAIRDFSLFRDCLWAHVVDWLPLDLGEDAALARLHSAWSKNSLRVQTLGMGLRTGTPQHVLTHQATRISHLIEPMRLAHLYDEPLFRIAVRGEVEAADRDFEQEVLREMEIRWQQEPERWERSYGISRSEISRLQRTGVDGTEQRLLLLRCWAAYLAEVVGGIADMSYQDQRELGEFLDNVRRDFFLRR